MLTGTLRYDTDEVENVHFYRCSFPPFFQVQFPAQKVTEGKAWSHSVRMANYISMMLKGSYRPSTLIAEPDFPSRRK